MTEISYDQKRACLVRELGMRRSVYPRWVTSGKMKAADAEREIRTLEAILEDYPELRPADLFTETRVEPGEPVYVRKLVWIGEGPSGRTEQQYIPAYAMDPQPPSGFAVVYLDGKTEILADLKEVFYRDPKPKSERIRQ